MFEPTSTWPNFAFGKRLTRIGTNNDHIWIPKVISCKVAHIMTTYEFLRSGVVILITIRSISNFTYLELLQLYLFGMAPNFT